MRFILLAVFSLLIFHCQSQFLMDMVDTTKDIGKSVLSVSQRFDHIRLGGYMQPQFQFAEQKGAKSYIGGDFPPNVDNRFMLRRGRIRFEYVRFNKTNKASVQFVFQFDGTERGVFIRDFGEGFLRINTSFFLLLPACSHVHLVMSLTFHPPTGKVRSEDG